jgi:hypothetical protein
VNGYHRDYSTADATGVRTPLRLGEDEAAVIERIPITIEVPGPVNFLVKGDSPDSLELLLHGKGRVRLTDLQGRSLAEQQIEGQAALNLATAIR